MSRKNSLQQSFIEIYSQDLIFSENDKQKVIQGLQNSTNKAERKNKFVLAFVTVLTPLVLLLLFLSSSDIFEKMGESEKHKQVAEIKPPPNDGEEAFGDIGFQKARMNGFVQQINQTAEDKGVAITINGAMYDGSRIIIVYSVDIKMEVKDAMERYELAHPIESLIINGKKFGDYSGAGGSTGKLNQNYTEYQLWAELPDQFELELQMKGIGGREYNFKFPLKKLDGIHKVINPKNSITNNNKTFQVEQVKFTPSVTNLIISATGQQSKQVNYKFQVTDQNGEKIAHMHSAGISGNRLDNGLFKVTNNEFYEPVNKIPKSITIQAYIKKEGDWGQIEAPLDQKTPIILEQDSISSIHITKVIQYQGEIWVYYDIKGPIENPNQLEFKEIKTNKPIIEFLGKGQYVKNKNGYIKKIKTSLSKEELIVTARINKYTKVDDLQMEIEIK